MIREENEKKVAEIRCVHCGGVLLKFEEDGRISLTCQRCHNDMVLDVHGNTVIFAEVNIWKTLKPCVSYTA